MRVSIVSWLLVMTFGGFAAAQAAPPATPGSASSGLTPAQALPRIVGQERNFAQRVTAYQPRVETYLQQLQRNRDGVYQPDGDQYFLGTVNLTRGLGEPLFTSSEHGGFFSNFHARYDPRGFVQMIMPDRFRFNETYYSFNYQGEQFLGDVRCLMYDVQPAHNAPHGSFMGRIWVEDRDYHIVRFDGTYVPDPMTHHFFHFDSWRALMGSGYWLPAAIYTEEGFGPRQNTLVKAQTRFWGYNLQAIQHSELTDVQVESGSTTVGVADQSRTSHDQSPLAQQRAWERKAEDDVLIRMEKAGLLSPPGPVDRILQQVVDNLVITNRLNVEPPVRCRIMLTTPLESFTVGHTIVLSRGLIDVLPDENGLAMVLADALGSIVLNQGINTAYAFDDRMIFPDQQLFQRIRMLKTPDQESAADQEAMTLLKNSPYAAQMSQAGLFLLAMSRQAPGMPNLLTAHMGNSMVLHGRLARMQALIAQAPQLRPRDVDQIAALPLGARIDLDPWNDNLKLLKAPAVPLVSERDKLSFEITPFHPYLTRDLGNGEQPVAANASQR